MEYDILFCRECGTYFKEYENGDIEELDRLPTLEDDKKAIDINCEEH